MSSALTPLFDAVTPVAIANDFTRVKNTYKRDRHGVLQTVWYQTRKSPRAGCVLFTVNLEAAILSIVRPGRLRMQPLSEQHWWVRLGEVLPQGVDTWWELGGEDIVGTVEEHVDYWESAIIPTLNTYAKASYLINEWRKGNCTHISEKQRIEFLLKAEAAGL